MTPPGGRLLGDLLEGHPGPLIVPMLVVTEVTDLLGTRLGTEAEVRFLGDLASANLIAEPVAASDWLRIALHKPTGITQRSCR